MSTFIAENLSNTRKSTSNRVPSATPQHSEKVRAIRNSQPSTANSAPSLQSLQRDLDALHRQHARLQQAIYEAAQIQRKLCAPRELHWGDFEIAGEIFPVRHLSGDFFKVMEIGAALGLVVGDIAGKGLSAGIWQAHMMHLVERAARTHAAPTDAVAEVNRILCQDPSEPPLTALFYARLDPQRNELEYCSAGLPAPLLLRRDQSVEQLEVGGPMLGATKDAQYSSGRVSLNPGDMLLAYSDGLTECRNARDEEFETFRLSAVANALHGASANQVLFSTLGAVLDFAEACSPADDLTLLVVRHRSAAPAKHVAAARNKDFPIPGERSIPSARPNQRSKGKPLPLAEPI
jgi:serine phosphatase RsbU (regulator of sigma subunit)